MRNFLARAKARVSSAWARFRAWLSATAIAILAALGVTVASYAEVRDISFTPPTQRVDGTAIPEGELAEHRLYCDGALTDTVAMPGTVFSPEFGLGSHECYATAVNIYGEESDPSASVSFVVTPAKPNPPVLSLP